MKCVKALKKNAEKIKKQLVKKQALSRTHRPLIGKLYIYFPLSKDVKGFTLIQKKCEEINKIPEINTKSFDHIGDIVILGEDATKSDAEKLLKRKNVKVVLKKKGIHGGEFRTQKLAFLAGEKRKETIYKESGIQMRLNVEDVYFSPRLGTERKRVADLVQDGEKVLVLFSGVAPYPLVIAKHSNPELIVGVEKNSIAHKYALENCKKYKNITLFNMDAKDFKYKEKFDRVLMPLPKSAEDFLEAAKKLTKKGGTIHFYAFGNEKDIPNSTLKKIKSKIKKFEILEIVKCGQYGPGKLRICIDIKI